MNYLWGVILSFNALKQIFDMSLVAAAAIGAGVSALGSVLGGVFGSSAARKRREALERMKKENQDWYDRRYNEDGTQRADALNLIRRTEDMMKKRSKAAAGRAAMMGGGDEVAAREKEAGNEAVANAVGQIAANNERRKDSIEQQYLSRKQALDAGIIEADAQRQEQIGNAVGGVIAAGGQLAASALGGGEDKKA